MTNRCYISIPDNEQCNRNTSLWMKPFWLKAHYNCRSPSIVALTQCRLHCSLWGWITEELGAQSRKLMRMSAEDFHYSSAE